MEQPVRILDGDLETLGLHATLKMLALGGKTGVLWVTSGQEQLQIALKDGHIIALEEAGATAPDLIEIHRLLTRISRQDASWLRQRAGNNSQAAMQLLVQHNLLPAEEAQRHIEFGITQALSRAVRWERGRFEFHRDAVPIQTRMTLHRPLSVDHVVLEALRLADERDASGNLSLSRHTIARWMPQFNGNVRQLGLSQEDVNVLCLANGQLPVASIAYGLLLPEPRVTQIMEKLLHLGLIELVDERLEGELEHSLITLLTRSQYLLARTGRPSADQRMLTLIRTMGTCINGLLLHHRRFARALRGRGEVPDAEACRYIDGRFRPLLLELQHEYPRMDEIVRLEHGGIVYSDLESLDRVVRGQELVECYRDGVLLLYAFMRRLFAAVIADEAGPSRLGRQFEDLWAAFLREIEEEIRPFATRHATIRA